jgi:hypothetical protein
MKMSMTLVGRGSKKEVELLFLFVMGRFPYGWSRQQSPGWSPPAKAEKGAGCRGLHKLDIFVAGGSSLTS